MGEGVKRFVRTGMQIQEKTGHYRTDMNIFYYKDGLGCMTSTIGIWAHCTELEALKELIGDLEFSLEQARKRVSEIE